MVVHEIIAGCTAADSLNFGNQTVDLAHNLANSPLFDDQALARLIEASDARMCHVNTMDTAHHDPRSRREGIVGRLTGREALSAVAQGRVWILLQHPDRIDPRYGDLLRQIYREFEELIPCLDTFKQRMSILISSPRVQVYYHADVPGQTLWQVRGTKRVLVYPNQPPFLPQPALERIVMGEAHEISLDYDERFDEAAEMIRLEPGRMLHWPLNCPHRIVNDDCVNVSFTTEHWTKELRNAYAVNYANGVIRRTLRLGDRQLARPVAGPGLWSRLGLAAIHKLSGLRRQRQQKFRIDFELDPRAPAGLTTIPAFELVK